MVGMTAFCVLLNPHSLLSRTQNILLLVGQNKREINRKMTLLWREHYFAPLYNPNYNPIFRATWPPRKKATNGRMQ
jgi:hypothetical protein